MNKALQIRGIEQINVDSLGAVFLLSGNYYNVYNSISCYFISNYAEFAGKNIRIYQFY